MKSSENYPDLTDAQVFHLMAKEGPDVNQWATEFCERVGARLGGYARKRLGKRLADREDAVNTIFMTAWKYRNRAPTDPDRFTQWLFCIARSICVDVTRERVNWGSLENVDAPTRESGPETQVRTREEHAELHEAIAELPEDAAKVVREHYWDELTTHEIAQRWEERTRLIRKRLERARFDLRILLEGEAPQAA